MFSKFMKLNPNKYLVGTTKKVVELEHLVPCVSESSLLYIQHGVESTGLYLRSDYWLELPWRASSANQLGVDLSTLQVTWIAQFDPRDHMISLLCFAKMSNGSDRQCKLTIYLMNPTPKKTGQYPHWVKYTVGCPNNLNGWIRLRGHSSLCLGI